MMKKLMLSTGSLALPCYETINAAEKFCFQGIELILPHEVSRDYLTSVKDAFSSSKLSTINLHAPFFSHDLIGYFLFPKAAIRKIFDAIILADKTLEPSNLVLHPFPAFFMKGARISFMREKLNALRKEVSCTISIENMGLPRNSFLDPNTLANPKHLADFAKSNGFSLTLDTTHCASRGISPEKAFDECKDCISNIHLSDFCNGREHLPLGEGKIGWKSFFSTLKKSNYSGFSTLEIDRKGLAEVSSSKALIDKLC